MNLINQPTLRPTRKMAAVGWTSLLGPTVAAIANALTDALGVRVRDLPLTRARIVAAIQEQEG